MYNMSDNGSVSQRNEPRSPKLSLPGSNSTNLFEYVERSCDHKCNNYEGNGLVYNISKKS